MERVETLPVGLLITPLGAIAADASIPSLSTRAAMPDALSRPRKPVATFAFRLLVKRALYLVAILVLPGALIALPLLWWLDRRRIRARSPRPDEGQGRAPWRSSRLARLFRKEANPCSKPSSNPC